MALQDILDAMDASSGKLCASIRQEAEEKAKAPMERAKEQLQAVRQKLLDEAEVRAQNYQSRVFADVRRMDRKNTAMAIAAMIGQVLGEASRSLQSARSDPKYPAFLEKLVREAVLNIPQRIRLCVDPRDTDLAAQIAAHQSSTISIHPEITTNGGIIASSEDGRITIRNTVETRLKEIERKNYSDLAVLLAPQFTSTERAA